MRIVLSLMTTAAIIFGPGVVHREGHGTPLGAIQIAARGLTTDYAAIAAR